MTCKALLQQQERFKQGNQARSLVPATKLLMPPNSSSVKSLLEVVQVAIF